MQYNIHADTRSLYLHWPFCPYKCHYCPFVALASQDQFMEKYHEALKKEVEFFIDSTRLCGALNTVYIGGGTPSTYPDNLLLDMFVTLRSGFIITNETEITLEVNPGTVKSHHIAFWKSIGINRLSIGVQSLNDSVLRSLNRYQSAQQVFELLGQTKNMIENISVDLIIGLPDSPRDEWYSLIRQVVTWPITHISMYFLTVHEDTPLYFKVKTNRTVLPLDEDIIERYLWARDFLAEHGIYQYEVSSFARPGYRSRHNSTYWEHKPYKAFGIGACSFDGMSRFQNEKNLMKYIEYISLGRNPIVFAEQLTPEQLRVEKIMLGLRRSEGVLLDIVFSELSDERRGILKSKIEELKEKRLLEVEQGVLKLTPLGLTLENAVVEQLS